MQLRSKALALVALVALGTAAAPVAGVPVGSAFTYQGRLADGGNPANGSYDLRFTLFDAATAGTQVGAPVTVDDVAVAQGLFTVSLDFGAGAFRGDARWLEVAARPGASTGAYTVVGVRQELRPAPNALFSGSAADVPWAGVSGKPPGFADNVDNDSGGTVTAVATGAGLTGGPITSSGTVSVATGGITTTLLANGAVTSPKIASGAIGLGQINTSQVQARIGGTCPIGSYLRGINPDGSVLCAGIPDPHTSSVLSLLGAGTVTIGFYSSIAVPPDGRPVIASQAVFPGDDSLGVVRCGNAACSAGNLPLLLDTGGPQFASHTSIAIGSDGFPVIAYHNDTAGTLKVAKCINVDCTFDVIVTTVDDHPVNTVGEYTSIAIGADGFPVISYYDRTAGALKVAKCVNVNCTGLNTITTVHNPPNDVGHDTSIAVGSDGLPVISYRDNTSGSLNVARCASAACNTGASITSVVPAGNVASGRGDMALGADGFPVISYERYQNPNSETRVLKCGNAPCTVGNTDNLVFSFFAALVGGIGSSIAIGADGLPVVSHAGLRITKCGDASCASGNVTSALDSPPGSIAGAYSSIAIGTDSLPIISHNDFFAGTLRVSKCGNIACSN